MLGCPRNETNRNRPFIELTSRLQERATRARYLLSNPNPELSVALNSDINVTPMIDVLLVLLVVFMISMQFRSLLSVNVPPPPDQSKPGHSAPQVVLELKEDGSYALNGTVTALETLSARLRELSEGGKRNMIFVRAAPRRPYREVIRAVDLAKGAGFQIVGYMP